MATTDTRDIIMAAAQPMVQARGYNALSFRDIAKQVGVKSASVHYHFPTKGDLGAALARRYAEEAKTLFDALLSENVAFPDGMRAYTSVFRAALANDNRMCLYGIMAAEHGDLPVEVRAEVDRFTDVNVDWLVEMLSRHKPTAGPEAIREQALAIFAAIEGAQLVSRGRGDIGVFDQCLHAYQMAGLFS